MTADRYARNCGVKDCPDRGRHEHTGALLPGEEVVLVVRRPDAPAACWANPRGILLAQTPLWLAVELTDPHWRSLDGVGIVTLRPGDAVRAKTWTAPPATPALRLLPGRKPEPLTDATEPTLFEEQP